MPPNEPNEEERQQELPQDNQTPFQPADPGQDSTQPATDTGVDSQEVYDEGVAGATETSEPAPGNDVGGYQPEQAGDQQSEGQQPDDQSGSAAPPTNPS